MSLPLANKVALITGASKGIGRATALKLSSLGASLAINYGRDTATAEALVTELGGPKRAVAIQADAGSIEGVKKLVASTVSHFGRIDILIPNAGLLMMKTVADTTEADFDRSFALNVKGPYFLVQQAVPHMQQGSAIVLISTTQNAASTVSAPYTLYCSTKGAVEQMCRTMSKDLATKGINVNCVAPGPTGTDLFYEGKSEQVLNMIKSHNPRNRIGEPEEVAEAIVWLSGQGARWTTGQILRVNGGQA